MSRRLVARWTLVAAVAAITTTAVFVTIRQHRATTALLPHVTAVEAHSVLPGGEHRFGDLIQGRLDILVPLEAVDPSTVSASLGTAPYRLVGPVRIERLRAGATGRVRYLFAIDCLESDACLPRRDRPGFTFARSQVRYRTRAGDTRSLTVGWPVLHVQPRPPRDILAPWEDGIRPLPVVGYRASPRAVAVLVALLSLLLLGGAAALLRPLVRQPGTSRRRQMTALELALATVRAAAARADIDERRRALDLLSRAVRAVGRRSTEARRLAWSQTMPRGQAMNELADHIEKE